MQERAVTDTATARVSAARTVALASVLGILLVTALMILAIRSILSGLRDVSSVADRLTDGDFQARVAGRRRDEIGALASAVNATADSLQGMMGRLQEQRDRDSFGREVNEALEMADTEEGTFQAIGRSLTAVSAAHPAELLVADSSRAHLELRAAHPDAGTPGCPVESPFACVAVRRGTTTAFPDSRALNACPQLRDRGGEPCSAVCVPVTFMGRALGVLHTTAPIDSPLAAEEIARLATLAASAGGRIGTVRSFERTQLQASTDGLTGLMNRRTFETTARALLRNGGLATIVMADLDHFKLINDTHGHETGDRALQLFAEHLRGHLRSDDLFARYGGEEFVLLLPGLAAAQAVEVLDRFRDRLAVTTSLQPPVFTSSFGVTDNESPDSLAGMIRRADAALYRAKALGRNCVVVDEIGTAGGVEADVGYDTACEDDPVEDLLTVR